jgi:hypothetical protein
LHFLHRRQHGWLEYFDVALSGDVEFGTTQNALNDFGKGIVELDFLTGRDNDLDIPLAKGTLDADFSSARAKGVASNSQKLININVLVVIFS